MLPSLPLTGVIKFEVRAIVGIETLRNQRMHGFRQGRPNTLRK